MSIAFDPAGSGRALGLLVAAVALVPGSGANARANRGYRTGGAHHAVLAATPTDGLEVGIPRDSHYAKGIAQDLQERWEDSYESFRKARDQFDHMLKQRPRWANMIRGWKLKAQWQMDQSRQLMSRTYAWRYRSSWVSIYRVAALHNKWLGIRAFTGQGNNKLKDQVIDAYRRLIQLSPYDDRPRIALAAMHHEVGNHAEGRKVFAAVRHGSRSYLSKDLAYYYAAAGMTDKAFHYVERSVKYSSGNRQFFLMSNDLDSLRADPRFKQLVGEP